MTTNRTRTIATILAFMLVVAVGAPAALAQTESSVEVGAEQAPDTGDVIVTVAENDASLENATIDVATDGNYSIGENVTTDANGTAVLPAPEETVDVTITATVDNVSVSENATLVPLEESLTLDVEQDDAQIPTVTVTQYDEPVTNASVDVATNDNTSYAGADTYETGENGTVDLPAPDEDVNVSVTATVERTNATLTDTWTGILAGTDLTVSAEQNDEYELEIAVEDGGEYVDGATVTVSEVNGTYAYADAYEAENGTLTLPAPTDNVTVDVSATDGNESDATTVDLVAPTDDNPNNDFAESLVKFIHFMKLEGTDGPLGQEISEFVHENNPASDTAQGPPENAGPPHAGDDVENDSDGTADENEVRGPPEHANGHGATETEREHEQNRTHNGTDNADDTDRDDDQDADDEAMSDDEADEYAADDEEANDAEADDNSRQGNGPPSFVTSG